VNGARSQRRTGTRAARSNEISHAVRAIRTAGQSRAHARDLYRKGYGGNATSAWTSARHRATERFQPGAVIGGTTWEANRERVRVALAVYGTAHTASEVISMRSGAPSCPGVRFGIFRD